MTFLKTLTFTDVIDVRPSPILRKRSRLISNLNDQLLLLENPSLCKSKVKWIKLEDGKKLIEKQVPVRAWWKETIDGQYSFFIKCGLKKVEFEKGKRAILVSKKEALATLIAGLIEAAQRGELDHIINEKDERQQVPIVKRKVA